jgi:peroxiredoxin
MVPAISDPKYYEPEDMKDSAAVIDGFFRFKRKQVNNIVYAYRFLVQSDSFSGATDFVFINGENIYVEIDSIDEHLSPKISNSPYQNEIVNEYNPFFTNFIKKVNEFYAYEEVVYNKYEGKIPKEKMKELEAAQQQLSHESDSLFQLYASLHPGSQVTQWKMIERLKNLGHNASFKNIFGKFPNEMQNATIGKHLLSDILNSELLSITSVFPAMKLQNTKGDVSVIDKTKLGNTFTLIDFWFTDCVPCRIQFPALKRLYTEYKACGFQIIGISIDEQSKINAWRSVIKNDALAWYQLLDKNGLATKNLDINSFPTNFLLNSDGMILQKNISIADLALLLSERCKKQ